VTSPTTTTPPAASSTPTTKLRWYHWHIIIIVTGTLINVIANGTYSDAFYLIPFNLLFWLPLSWTISLVFRKR
jgi:hypothetical protein